MKWTIQKFQEGIPRLQISQSFTSLLTGICCIKVILISRNPIMEWSKSFPVPSLPSNSHSSHPQHFPNPKFRKLCLAKITGFFRSVFEISGRDNLNQLRMCPGRERGTKFREKNLHFLLLFFEMLLHFLPSFWWRTGSVCHTLGLQTFAEFLVPCFPQIAALADFGNSHPPFSSFYYSTLLKYCQYLNQQLLLRGFPWGFLELNLFRGWKMHPIVLLQEKKRFFTLFYFRKQKVFPVVLLQEEKRFSHCFALGKKGFSCCLALGKKRVFPFCFRKKRFFPLSCFRKKGFSYF